MIVVCMVRDGDHVCPRMEKRIEIVRISSPLGVTSDDTAARVQIAGTSLPTWQKTQQKFASKRKENFNEIVILLDADYALHLTTRCYYISYWCWIYDGYLILISRSI